jgi:hypothetical protein
VESRCRRRAHLLPGRLRAPTDSRRHCLRVGAAWRGERMIERISRRLLFIERGLSPPGARAAGAGAA